MQLPPLPVAEVDTSAPPIPAAAPVALTMSGDADTTRARPRAVEISDAYETRLTIHRWTSYAIIPLFAYEWIVGQQLYNGLQSAEGPASWLRPAHKAGAWALAGAFTVNTVTGAWNWWDQRDVPEGRTLRTLHSLTMLVADAGFTWTGAKLSQDAKYSLAKRRQHRAVAIGSMALTAVSGSVMWLANHR